MFTAAAAFEVVQRRAIRLEVAITEWSTDEEDLPSDIASALWCETRCPGILALHEERLQAW